MTGLKRSATLALCVALVFIFAGVSDAQVTTGRIFGRVLDASGAVLPGAAVTATNAGTAATKATVTDGRGEFTLSFLPSGTYEVRIEIQGFKTLTQGGIAVGSGQDLDLDYSLEIGTQSEVVQVISEAPLLNTTSAQEDIRISEKMVDELPMNHRDITQLLNTGPGTSAGGSGTSGVISVNGLPPRGFTFSVDGVDASPDSEFPGLGLYQNYNYIKGVSVDAIKEVEVSKNIFSAEIGMTVSGNVNIITKGGTNEFHGAVFENYQSGGLAAASHFGNQKFSGVFHQFGANLGGPLVKDKVFFFGLYEGYRETQQQPFSGEVPANEIRQLVGGSLPASNAYWDLYPAPTGPSEDGLAAPYIGANPASRDENHFVGRLDFNLNQSDLLTLRFTRGRPNQLAPRIAAGNSRARRGETENVAATFTKVLSSNVLTEFRVGWNRNVTNRVDLITEALATTIGLPGLPDTSGELFIKSGKNWSVENTWSITAGRHNIKFGAIYRNWLGQRINEEQPVFEFASVGDLVAGRYEQAEFQFALQQFEITSFDAGIFIQDDFRASPDLMLNLGLRYDYSGVPNERDDRFYNRDGPYGGAEGGQGFIQYLDPDSVWNANWDLISPRVGFAWSVDERTVLRGGVGIFYIPFNLFAGPVEIVQNGLGVPVEANVDFSAGNPLGISYGISNPDATAILAGQSQCDQTARTCPTTGTISDSSVAQDRPNPYSIQFTLGLSRQLTDTLAFDIAYVGNRGSRLSYSPDMNRPNRATGIRPVAGIGQPRHYSQEDTSTYHALQTSLRRRFADSFSAGVHYTYASNLSFFRGDFTCCGRNYNPQDVTSDGLTTVLTNNRGRTPYHVRHRLFADFVWELPLGDSVIGEGWQFGGLLDIRTGTPLLFEQGTSSDPGARPDFTGNGPADAILSGYGSPPYQYLNTSLFPLVPRNDVGRLARPGTAGARFVSGPSYWSADLSLSKSFDFGRGARLQFRADLFNAFNHTNFNNPQDDRDRGNFGFITSAQRGRITQLSVRVSF